MKNAYRYIIIVLLFFMLVAVRFFENSLFYDPLNDFFHGTFKGKPLPDMNTGKLVLNITFRYLVNSVISCVIIYIAFSKTNYLKFAAGVYAGVFLILLPVFLIVLNTAEEGDHLSLFYVRRVLIHPLLLFVLLPAVYYQKRSTEK